jgi:hypothetical protein
VVEKRTLGGELLMTIGTRFRAMPIMLRAPFNQPTGVYLVPHGEFYDADELGQWLSDELALDGEYAVASQYYWRNVIPDSTCLFQKKKTIVGEGKMVGGLVSYSGIGISPLTGRRYAGMVHFASTSIKVYKKPISFTEAEKLLGKTLTFRGMQKLTAKDYEIIHRAS